MSLEHDYKNEIDQIRLSDEARERIGTVLAEAQASLKHESERIEVPIGVKLVEPKDEARSFWTSAGTPSAKRPQPRRWRPGVWVPAAALAACAALLLVAVPAALSVWRGMAVTSSTVLADVSVAESAVTDQDAGLFASAGSYKDIYEAISGMVEGAYYSRDAVDSGSDGSIGSVMRSPVFPSLLGITEALSDLGRSKQSQSSASDTAAPSLEGGAAMGGADESSKNYSTTNVQVEGIDEADIVKTDGDYLYILSGDRLIIAKADGKNTRVVSKTTITGQTDEAYPVEMFIDGDRLIVLVTQYAYSIYREYDMVGGGFVDDELAAPRGPLRTLFDILTGRWFIDTRQQIEKRSIDTIDAVADIAYLPSQTRTFAYTFDVSDPAHPHKVARSGQDGEYVTARMVGGIVYLITTHTVWEQPVLDEPRTFVPSLYAEDKATVLEPERVIVAERPESASYVVITSLSTRTGAHLDGQTLLGYTSTVYMSHTNLIVAQSVYENRVIDSWREDQYVVEHRREGFTTHLIRLGIDRGRISFEAQGSVPGELLNQFSVDEYRDTVRVVTTVWGSETKVYIDERRGFENYEYLDNSTQSNGLYVLDLDLDVIGKVVDLAAGEQVYSVRFAGDIAYFVTFRQVDPLFAVDLSNPRNPVVLSALKIPGFSQYLHPYADGLLFGLGMEADEATGRTSTMKLSMFDTSDPTDVFEKHKLVIDATYSEALYNHKAILVLADRGIVAFPAEEGFVVFSYSRQTGFTQEGRFNFPDAYGSRGVVIGELLYVCAPASIGVFRLADLSPLAHLMF